MSGFVVARDRYDRQVMRREFGWARNDPRRAALADFTCAIMCPAPEAEKTGIGPCPSPALLDVAGSGTTIRSAAGLTHLHVDHPQLSGFRLDVKESCSRFAMKRRTMPTMSGLGSCSWQPAYRKKPADIAVGTASQK
jgi:hypothetical protein